MLAEPEMLVYVEKKLQKQLQEELSVMRSKPYFLNLQKKASQKGTSLHYTIQQLGITRDEVIAIGDSYNDLAMIEFAELRM